MHGNKDIPNIHDEDDQELTGPNNTERIGRKGRPVQRAPWFVNPHPSMAEGVEDERRVNKHGFSYVTIDQCPQDVFGYYTQDPLQLLCQNEEQGETEFNNYLHDFLLDMAILADQTEKPERVISIRRGLIYMKPTDAGLDWTTDQEERIGVYNADVQENPPFEPITPRSTGKGISMRTLRKEGIRAQKTYRPPKSRWRKL